MKHHVFWMLTILAGLGMTQAAQAHHDGDFIIGAAGAAGSQLKFEFDADILAGNEFITLPASESPSIAGWLSDEPGFEALEADEPDEGIYALSEGAQIRLVGVDLDPGLFVRAPSIGTPVRISPSPTLGYLALGDHELHTHAVWHVDSSAAGFQPQTAWYGTFKLVDVGTTGYADSEPFTVGFVPEPASIFLLAGGAVLALTRRRA
jgi:hypothetical protein